MIMLVVISRAQAHKAEIARRGKSFPKGEHKNCSRQLCFTCGESFDKGTHNCPLEFYVAHQEAFLKGTHDNCPLSWWRLR